MPHTPGKGIFTPRNSYLFGDSIKPASTWALRYSASSKPRLKNCEFIAKIGGFQGGHEGSKGGTISRAPKSPHNYFFQYKYICIRKTSVSNMGGGGQTCFSRAPSNLVTPLAALSFEALLAPVSTRCATTDYKATLSTYTQRSTDDGFWARTCNRADCES